MGFTLAGKVIAITGAGRGIGREIALLCARYGASIVVNDFGVSVEGNTPGASLGVFPSTETPKSLTTMEAP